MRWSGWCFVLLVACVGQESPDPVETDTDGGVDPGTLDADQDGVVASRDCDDNDATVFPGAPELCDGVDNDCDGKRDDEDSAVSAQSATRWYEDGDRDGTGGADLGLACTAPRRGVALGGDCDDDDPRVYPGATEVCDGVDNNCDALADDLDPGLDAATAVTWFADRDGDGWGDPNAQQRSCVQPDRTVSRAGDCADADPRQWASNPEVCDGVDNNCDGAVDADDPAIDPGLLTAFYADDDRDGAGDPADVVQACVNPGGRVTGAGDCDDGDARRRAGATEVCDGVDNDCDAQRRIDDADPNLDRSTGQTFYRDRDADGAGDAATVVRACLQPAGTVLVAGDCDDNNNAAAPGLPEVCDGVDNDCRNGADDADPNLDRSTRRTFYVDADTDGRGDPAAARLACARPAGTVANSNDCNDRQSLAWTGNVEVCDGVDNDCVNGVDEDDPNLDPATARTVYLDRDGDSWGDPRTAFPACTLPAGAVGRAGDCNDAEPLAWTGNTEVCDGVDNDCRNGTDAADPNLDVSTALATWLDRDADGYGDPATLAPACGSVPAGRAARAGDCNDREPRARTGAPEVCDGVDNDCTNGVDDADPNVDLSTQRDWYRDLDGDGYGVAGPSLRRCTPPPDAADNTGDCNDREPRAWTGNTEVCDGVDNDCVNGADDADPNLSAASATPWYDDRDNDGYAGEPEVGRACRPPVGAPLVAEDCDDTRFVVAPGAAEVCDRLDNDCDLLIDDADPSVSGQPAQYRDTDGDGYGTGAPVYACDPGPGWAQRDGDCGPANRLVNPGGTESCNGLDDDCDGVTDTDTWAQPGLPYRVLLTVQTPPTAMLAAPVAVDLNLASALTALGDNSGTQPGSVRVSLQACARSLPAVPSEVIDGVGGVFARQAIGATLHDGIGALVLRYDHDGNVATRELQPASTTLTYGVYFGSRRTSPNAQPQTLNTSLSAFANAATAELSNDQTVASMRADLGGLVDQLGPVGGDLRVGSMTLTASQVGNGLYLTEPGTGANGAWLSARSNAAATLRLVHAGPLFAAVQTEGVVGNAYGGFRYVYTWMMFEGRPELYAKVRWVTDRPTQVGPLGFNWSGLVRPWLTDNAAVLAAAGSGVGSEDAGLTWVRGTYDEAGDPFGLALGWRVAPAAMGNPVDAPNGRWVGLAGQDLQTVGLTGSATLATGQSVLQDVLLAAYPHEGRFETVQDDFFASLAGYSSTWSAPEAR